MHEATTRHAAFASLRRPIIALLAVALLTVAFQAAALPAAQEKADEGWVTLFGGDKADLDKNWNYDAKKDAWQVQDGALTLAKKGGGYVWTKEAFGDFVLELEFKTAGNSGVFFRSDPKNPVNGGFEVQVINSAGKKDPGKHDAGALYDVMPPKVNAVTDDWNKLKIQAQGPNLSCWMNGQEQWTVDISKWTEVGKNPDGTPNKYGKALKDFPREGKIGLQEHGAVVAYRNIRVKPLK